MPPRATKPGQRPSAVWGTRPIRPNIWRRMERTAYWYWLARLSIDPGARFELSKNTRTLERIAHQEIVRGRELLVVERRQRELEKTIREDMRTGGFIEFMDDIRRG